MNSQTNPHEDSHFTYDIRALQLVIENILGNIKHNVDPVLIVGLIINKLIIN
jgi:hypothetical protein